jgi:hypothetical protein
VKENCDASAQARRPVPAADHLVAVLAVAAGIDIDRTTPWRALQDLKVADAMRPFQPPLAVPPTPSGAVAEHTDEETPAGEPPAPLNGYQVIELTVTDASPAAGAQLGSVAWPPASMPVAVLRATTPTSSLTPRSPCAPATASASSPPRQRTRHEPRSDGDLTPRGTLAPASPAWRARRTISCRLPVARTAVTAGHSRPGRG